MTHLIWLRNDLRLEDNPALYYGAQQNPCYAVYIVSQQQWQSHYDAPAKIALWRQRLIHLSKEMAQKNIPLKLLFVDWWKDIPAALLSLAQANDSQAIFFNNEYALNEKNRDAQVQALFAEHNLGVHRYDGDVVMPPGSVMTQQQAIYKVFTPFSRQWHKQVSEDHLTVLPKPRKQQHSPLDADNISDLWPEPVSSGHQASYREDLWPASTQHIHQRMERFCSQKAEIYKEQRDHPGINGTSTLSPYLVMGAISPRQCIACARQYLPHWRENQWVTELIWREFYRHLTDHYPHLSRSENFIKTTNPIPWENDDELFQAWCEGNTGFPIVDAAMRQLRQTGWMHNRLRMITAAFLTKLLLVDWRKGEQFFMENLVDGDYASNNGGWQWAASTGADAAPYFRIFNPLRQSERFDKEGQFIRKLVPELSPISGKSIHQPKDEQRAQCQYPQPIIDYTYARQRALDGYAKAMGKQKEA